mmetsp:Transcript_49934/g.117630  ORF Transcript_49934/g.117630 Transcript_49934/m.117630 type:complete len:386 (+) Transcript_49934:792-1949(+)
MTRSTSMKKTMTTTTTRKIMRSTRSTTIMTKQRTVKTSTQRRRSTSTKITRKLFRARRKASALSLKQAPSSSSSSTSTLLRHSSSCRSPLQCAGPTPARSSSSLLRTRRRSSRAAQTGWSRPPARRWRSRYWKEVWCANRSWHCERSGATALPARSSLRSALSSASSSWFRCCASALLPCCPTSTASQPASCSPWLSSTLSPSHSRSLAPATPGKQAPASSLAFLQLSSSSISSISTRNLYHPPPPPSSTPFLLRSSTPPTPRSTTTTPSSSTRHPTRAPAQRPACSSLLSHACSRPRIRLRPFTPRKLSPATTFRSSRRRFLSDRTSRQPTAWSLANASGRTSPTPSRSSRLSAQLSALRSRRRMWRLARARWESWCKRKRTRW